MNVREAIGEKKNVFRIATTGNGLTFVLSSDLKIKDGFLNVNQEDFTYTLGQMKDGKKIHTTVSGDFSQSNRNINKNQVLSWEEILPTDKSYESLKTIIDRCVADKNNIALPPEKTIEIVGG